MRIKIQEAIYFDWLLFFHGTIRQWYCKSLQFEKLTKTKTEDRIIGFFEQIILDKLICFGNISNVFWNSNQNIKCIAQKIIIFK